MSVFIRLYANNTCMHTNQPNKMHIANMLFHSLGGKLSKGKISFEFVIDNINIAAIMKQT